MRLEGKVCAITGAGSGIGRAAARLFAAEGASVIILEVNEDAGCSVQKEIEDSGGRAAFIVVDISDVDAVRDAFEKIRAEYCRLDVLYNNASVFLGKQDAAVGELSVDVWHKIISINLHGLFYCCKYGIPLIMESGGGSVITTASSASVIGIPNCDAYTAAKGATVAMTRSMAVEYGPKKVRVNCIAPAAINTPMLQESNLDDPDFDEKAFFRNAPLGRYGSPEEVARAALFLASDESSYINGAMLVADGGITIT